MLDAYIIDAIKKEEEERERAYQSRLLYLELPMPAMPERKDEPVEDRGPIVIPLTPDLEEDAA